MTNTANKPLPILIDRLAHSLKAQGVKIKRSQLLEIAAGAFGYRNSNEMTAANKAGELTPPEAMPLGTVTLPGGQRLVVMMDPLARAPYAVDESFLEQVASEARREEIGVTPYGHLAGMTAALAYDGSGFDGIGFDEAIDIDTEARSEVHVAVVKHKHGTNHYISLDRDGIIMQVAEYVRENWNEVSEFADKDEDPNLMTDEKVVEVYFELCENHGIEEYLETSVETIIGRATAKIENQIPSSEALLAIANDLAEGEAADIYYDVRSFGDENGEEEAIEKAQSAMSSAATILRNLANSKPPETQKVASAKPDIEAELATAERQEHEPVWITDEDGQDTMQVTASDMIALGLDFYKDDEGALPLIENEYGQLGGGQVLNQDSKYRVRLGFSVLYRNAKWLAPEISFEWDIERYDEREGALDRAKAYMAEKKSVIEQLGGHLILSEDATDNMHELAILLPFPMADEAVEQYDWEAALAWLLLPEAERKHCVTATFIPEVDMNGHVVPVDAKGDPSWDATFDALRWGEEYARDIIDGSRDSDYYATDSSFAPEWVVQWASINPFTVNLHGLADLFNLDQ